MPYDKVALREILSDAAYRTIDDQGSVLPPANKIFLSISEKMADKGSSITPKHVHTIVNNNRAGFRDLILQVFNIQEQVVSICENDGNYSAKNCTDLSSDTIASLTSIKVTLVISEEKWQSIAPQEKIYGKRIYWKLRPGWADVVAEAIWIQHHLDCVFVFKNHSIFLSAIAKFYLIIEGFCRECHAKIHCTLLKEPSKGCDVILECKVEGIRAASHSGEKRRQLRGIRRREVADFLIDGGKDAVTWRRKEAARIKKFGDKNPPILPTNEVIRKAKEQRLLKKYGLQFGNPALNLLKSTEHGKLVGSIQSIGLHKFNCMYWLPEQLQIYVSRVRNDPNATLAIDATGGVVKRNESQQPHVLLYQCVLVTREGSVPTFQMISADQRSIIVNSFFSHILAANAPIPPIVVTDFGWSLLIAVAQVFAGCKNLNDYLQRCYNAITGEKTSLPSTFIRLDVCHLMAMVTRWPSLKGKDKNLVRRFYKRCIGKALQISNLEDLAYFVESVLVVALSKCIGSESSGKVLPSVNRLHFLNNKIKGIELSKDDDTEADDQSDEETRDMNIGVSEIDAEENAAECESEITGWKSWRDNLYDTAVIIADQSSDGDTINACYNPDFAKRLKRYLLPYTPLWTAIMVPVFKRGSLTATSAAVEAEFADIKNRDFRGEIPMRPDRFVIQHLEKLNNKIKERCTVSDAATVNADIELKALVSTKLHGASHSKVEDDQNSMEVDDPQHSTIEFGELSFEMKMQNNGCSTPDEKTKNGLASFQQTESLPLQSAGILPEHTIAVVDSSSSLDNATYEIAQSSRDENIPADNDWNVQEEWRGLEKNTKLSLNDDPQKKKRVKPTSLDDCPEWDFIKNSTTANIPILLNGNIAGSVRLEGAYVNVTSTCAFDSIFQGILGGLLANKMYCDKLESSDCPVVNLAQSVIDKKKILKEHYVQRAKILTAIPIFEGSVVAYTRNIKRLDVECNAAHLAQYLLEKEPSYICRMECPCGYKNEKKYGFLSVNIDMILCHGFHTIQDAIDDYIALERSCFDCKKKISCSNEYGSHLVIDTTVCSDPGYPRRKNIILPKLNSIEKTIKVGGKTYICAAIIDYSTEKKHYVAYGLAGEFWQKYDGLIKKRSATNPKTTITPHLIIYTLCED